MNMAKEDRICLYCLYSGTKWLTQKQGVFFCFLFNCTTESDRSACNCEHFKPLLDLRVKHSEE